MPNGGWVWFFLPKSMFFFRLVNLFFLSFIFLSEFSSFFFLDIRCLWWTVKNIFYKFRWISGNITWDLVYPGQNHDASEILRNVIGCLEDWELEKTDFSRKTIILDWCIQRINQSFFIYLFFFFFQRKEEILLKFNDIVYNFQETLDKIINEQDCKVSKEFSVMGGNLFRGILEEFQKNKLVNFPIIIFCYYLLIFLHYIFVISYVTY